MAAAEEVSGRTDMSRGIAHDACRLRFPEYGQGRATLMEPQRTRKSPVAVKPKGLMVAGTQYVQHLCRWWKRGAAAKPVTPTFLPSQASYPVFRRYSRNASDSRLRLTPLEGAVEDSMLDACAPPTSRVSTRKAPWRKPGGLMFFALSTCRPPFLGILRLPTQVCKSLRILSAAGLLRNLGVSIRCSDLL